MKYNSPKSIDEYIDKFPNNIQIKLRRIRATIRKAAPNAIETISYQIPTFRLVMNLVHFAAFSDHISFFPTSSGVTKFMNELKGYRVSKGTIQFPLDKPIPYGLILRITKFRVKENLEREKKKRKSESK
jgi:uncharacterized protein YdhG (YjbR/CyaY superfamily)